MQEVLPWVAEQVASEVSNSTQGQAAAAAAGGSRGVGCAGCRRLAWAAGGGGGGLHWALVTRQHGAGKTPGSHCIQILQNRTTGICQLLLPDSFNVQGCTSSVTRSRRPEWLLQLPTASAEDDTATK
jgi:hypothetical protein